MKEKGGLLLLTRHHFMIDIASVLAKPWTHESDTSHQSFTYVSLSQQQRVTENSDDTESCDVEHTWQRHVDVDRGTAWTMNGTSKTIDSELL